MAVVKELIRPEEDGSISFGDYELSQKTKKSDVEVHGDSYKVKTFSDVTFRVEGPEDAQIILGLADNASYRVCIDGEDQGIMETGMGGKLVLSVELQAAESVLVEVKKD